MNSLNEPFLNVADLADTPSATVLEPEPAQEKPDNPFKAEAYDIIRGHMQQLDQIWWDRILPESPDDDLRKAIDDQDKDQVQFLMASWVLDCKSDTEDWIALKRAQVRSWPEACRKELVRVLALYQEKFGELKSKQAAIILVERNWEHIKTGGIVERLPLPYRPDTDITLSD